ncbi:MAG: 5-bromo-4-chloroindolyl phosphate hydrolysis family protein [Proteobacteria bacterium]|nr:5-bromo-4-chloroindolyl phosphate hydrolysis family protein [Pseudomonadota bacterium]MBW3616739.1 5-bromo-4-chloroindolyl phosphate hydrolysis family protein [Pseudomonadota bacterium]
MTSGGAATIAGIVAALLPPPLVLALGVPAWVAVMLAFAVFVGLFLLLKPKNRPAPGRLDPAAVSDQRRGTAADLLREGEAALDRLRAAPRRIHDQLMREEIRLLTMKADRVLREVRHDPDKVMAVRRLLTFYLPNAASVAEGWRALENKSEPSPERVRETRQTMAQLNDAFTRFADDLHEPQLQTLDLDLKVLNDALRQDLDLLRR